MRQKYNGVTKDQNGAIIQSATVSVFLAGTSTAASIYTTLAGSTAVNSVTSDSTDGTFSFYVDRFDYDIEQAFDLTITKSFSAVSYSSQTISNVSVVNTCLGTYTISADKTVNVYTEIPNGVIYSIATGVTLIYTKQPKIDGVYQVYSLTGTGKVLGLEYARPEWFSSNFKTGMEAAGAAANSIRLSAGTYSALADITIPYNVKEIIGEGKENTIIDGTGGTFTTAVLKCDGGGFTETTTLGANITEGDTTLTFSDDMSATLSRGDVICVFDSTEKSYSNANAGYYSGEYFEVDSVSTVTVTPTHPSFYSYTAANIVVTILTNPTGIRLSGFTVKGPGGTDQVTACRIRYGKNVSVDNCRFYNAYWIGLNIKQTYGAKISGCDMECVFSTNNGTNYGCTCTNSQKIQVTNCQGTSVRHAFDLGGSTTTGDTDPCPVNREVTVQNNIFKTTGNLYAMSCHGNSEHVIYKSNIVNGSLAMCGNHLIAEGNDISKCSTSAGILINEIKGADITVKNNTITGLAAGTGSFGIRLVFYRTGSTNYYDDAKGTTVISGNKIYATLSTATVCGVSLTKSASNTTALNVVIENNVIDCDTAGTYGMYVVDSGASGMNVTMRNNTIKYGHIFIDDAERVICNGNIVEDGDCTYNGIAIYGRHGTNYFQCNNNYVYNSGRCGIFLYTTHDTTDKYLICHDNVVINPSLSADTDDPGIYLYHAYNTGAYSDLRNNTVVIGSGSSTAESIYKGARFWIGDIQERLLSKTTVSFAADADTTLYTVPTGKRCVLTKAIVVAADNANSTDLSIGANGSETDWVGPIQLDNLNAQYDSIVIMPVPNTTPVIGKSYAATTVIQAKVENQAGAADNTIYLYGILY